MDNSISKEKVVCEKCGHENNVIWKSCMITDIEKDMKHVDALIQREDMVRHCEHCNAPLPILCQTAVFSPSMNVLLIYTRDIYEFESDEFSDNFIKALSKEFPGENFRAEYVNDGKEFCKKAELLKHRYDTRMVELLKLSLIETKHTYTSPQIHVFDSMLMFEERHKGFCISKSKVSMLTKKYKYILDLDMSKHIDIDWAVEFACRHHLVFDIDTVSFSVSF